MRRWTLRILVSLCGMGTPRRSTPPAKPSTAALLAMPKAIVTTSARQAASGSREASGRVPQLAQHDLLKARFTPVVFFWSWWDAPLVAPVAYRSSERRVFPFGRSRDCTAPPSDSAHPY
jgi:hypothetical protein